MKQTPKITIALLAILTLALMPVAASAQGVLFVKNDNVGIGTDNPTSPLHVKKTGGAASFLFESDGATWNFKSNNAGNFLISRIGTGLTEFTLTTGGTASTMIVGGTIKATDFTPTSSKSLKENFLPLNQREVLDKVLGLPITEWNFINDQSGIRHIGPMAEDFHSAFGTGADNKRISLLDTNGVTIAAVQGLYQMVQDRDQQIDALTQRLEQLELKLSDQ